MNRRLTFSVIAGSSCGLMFGYDIGVLSSIAPELKTQFALSATTLGIAISSALVGTILGAAVAGLVADAIDRRPTLILSGFIYIFAALGATLAPAFVPFTLCRFVCGIAIGLISVVAPMYLAEICPSHLRGRAVGSFQFTLSIGVVLAFAVAYVLSIRLHSGSLWRYSLGSSIVAGLISEVLLIQAVASPRWLALKGRAAQLQSTFAALGSADPEADQAALLASLRQLGSARQQHLFSKRHTRPILLALSVAIFNQLTGANALLYYILVVFSDLSAGQLNGRKDALIVSALSLAITAVAVSVIDHVGRKPLLLLGAVGMGTCLALFSIIRVLHWPPSSVVIILIVYNLFFGFSQGAIVWVYLSEIFPLPLRARGQSLGSTVLWITNALVVGTFPALTSTLGAKVFWIFASVMAAQFFVVLYCYPETKRRGLESLAAEISS